MEKEFFLSDIYVSAETIIHKEEVAKLSAEELKIRISKELCYNESETPINTYHRKNRAKGLENLLYRCADCGSLYTTRTKASDLYCTACGKLHHLDERYLFTDDIKSIPAYYDRIKEMEKGELGETVLSCDVKVKIFSGNFPYVKRTRGICTLTKDYFCFASKSGGFKRPTGELSALAFSCGKEFELYHEQEEYYFYPVQNPQQVARWALFIDLLYEESCQNKKMTA